MIRPLRQRHRVLVLALGVVVPVAFATGIATRNAVPFLTGTTPDLSGEVHNYSEVWSRDDLWEKKAISTRLLSDAAGAGRRAVELIAKDQIIRPDVIVYWVPGGPEVKESLPNDAVWLGGFDQLAPRPLTLPAEAAQKTGALVLYSLADHEVIAVSRAFAIAQ
jgi:hypothetical protein